MLAMSRWTSIAAAAAIVVSASTSSAASSTGTAPCSQITSTLSSQRELACIGKGAAGGVLYRSGDGGRTWSVRSATGVVIGGPTVGAVAFSPAFASDHALFWATDQGLFRSTDDGSTFTNVDPFYSGNPELGPRLVLLQATLPSVVDRVGAIMAGGPEPMPSWLYQGVTEIPVGGTPVGDVDFAVTPAGGGFAIGSEVAPGATGPTFSVWGCNAGWTCGTRLSTLAASSPSVITNFKRAVLSPNFDRDHTAVLFTGNSVGVTSAWRTTDGGRSIRPWPAVQKLIDAMPRARGGLTSIGFSFSVDSKTQWLRLRGLHGGGLHEAGLVEALWVSHDSGRTWSPRGLGRQTVQGGGRVTTSGDLPWEPGSTNMTSADITLAAGGLLLTAVSNDAATTWCSRDDGRSWRKTCA